MKGDYTLESDSSRNNLSHSDFIQVMPVFTICRVHSTETFGVSAHLSLRVSTLKKEVESFYSVPVYQQYLVFKGKKLEDDMILSSLQYVEGANVIYLLVKNERALLKLIIFLPGEKKKKLIFPDNSDIKALRLAIIHLGGYSEDRQFMILFHGKVLDANCLLSEYKIKNKSRIFIRFLDGS
jgi:hypothetical protein